MPLPLPRSPAVDVDTCPPISWAWFGNSLLQVLALLPWPQLMRPSWWAQGLGSSICPPWELSAGETSADGLIDTITATHCDPGGPPEAHSYPIVRGTPRSLEEGPQWSEKPGPRQGVQTQSPRAL